MRAWTKSIIVKKFCIGAIATGMQLLWFFVYSIPSTSAAVPMEGRTFYGDTTNAGTYKYAILTDNAEGQEVNGNASTASNITFIKAAHAPTRDEFTIGHIKLNGRMDIFTCTGLCDDTSDDTSAFNKTTVSSAQSCDTTFGSCWRPFDIAYETGSGRTLVAFIDTASDGTVKYCLYNGSAWSPTNCTTPSSYSFNGGSSVDAKWVRLVPRGELLKTGRPNDILLLVADTNNDLFAAIWNGTSFGNLTTITTNLSTYEIQNFDGGWENGTGDAFVAWSEGTSTTTTPFRYKKWTRSSSTWDSSATAFPAMGASHIGHWVTLASSPIEGSDHIGIVTMSATTVGNNCGTASQCRGQPWIWDGSTLTLGTEWTTTEPIFAKLCDVAVQANSTEDVFVYSCSDGAGSDSSDTLTWNISEDFATTTDIPGAMGDDAVLIQLTAHPNSIGLWITGEDIDADCNGSLWDGFTAATWDNSGCNSGGENALAPLSHTSQPSEGGPFWVAPIPYSPYSRNWRFYDDETTNDPSTGLNGAAENAKPADVYKEEYIRLRMQFTERTGNGETDARKRLEWTTGDPNSPATTWTEVKDATNTSAIWRYASNANGDPVCSSCDDNTAISTTRLTGTTTPGTYVTDRDATPGGNMDHPALSIVEFDYPLKAENTVASTTYYFRAYDIDQNTPVYRRADVTNDCLSVSCSYPRITMSALLLSSAPTIHTPFDNERLSDTTPAFEFTGSDPNASNTLIYHVQWDDDGDVNASPLGTCASDGGACGGSYENTEDAGDTSPFTEDQRIRFTLSSALTNGVTYYWRVRVKDGGTGEYGEWSTVRSFTVDTSVAQSDWHQTQDEQFDLGDLIDTETYGNDDVRIPLTPRRALLVYGEGTSSVPAYRIWKGSSWSASGAALDVGAQINWVVTKAASTRGGEYLIATLGTDGGIDAQVFDRMTGMWGNLQAIATANDAALRGVDIAYETTSGDGILVACDGDADPSYWVWNGSSWSGPTTIDISSTGNCDWVKLAADPTTDEIILVTQDSSQDFRAIVWDGGAWGNESNPSDSSPVSGDESIAVEYEEGGGEGVAVVSRNTKNQFLYSTWNGSSWSSWSTFNIGDDFKRGALKRDVGTDAMVLCYIDTDNDIGIVRWDGSAWQSYQEFETTGNADTDRAVDCVFETTSGRDGYIMVPYSSTTAASYNGWDGASLFGKGSVDGLEDAATVQTRRTGDGKVLGIFLDDANTRLDFSLWDGIDWSSGETLEEDTSVTSSPYKEPYMMDAAQVLGLGTIMSAPVDFDSHIGATAWNEVNWTENETLGIISLQVYYKVTADCDTIIPDSAIAGNSSGISAGPIDISGLNTTTYNRICLKATLTFLGGTPYLQDWTVTWTLNANDANKDYFWILE